MDNQIGKINGKVFGSQVYNSLPESSATSAERQVQ